MSYCAKSSEIGYFLYYRYYYYAEIKDLTLAIIILDRSYKISIARSFAKQQCHDIWVSGFKRDRKI